MLNDEINIFVFATNTFTPKNLTYRVDISQRPNEIFTELVTLNGGQNQMQFNYRYPNHTVCDTFSFTVTPISDSGMEGISSEPVTGFFTTVTGTVNYYKTYFMLDNYYRQ